MAGLPSGLGGVTAPQYGTGDSSPTPPDADQDQGADTTLQTLVADAHKLAAELTRYAITEEQEDQDQGPVGPTGPPQGGPPTPQGM